MKKISILIPCYNEEQSLPQLYPELVKLMDGNTGYEWELMFVNDGSIDGTLQVLKNMRLQDNRVNYLDLSRNFGKEAAMLAGFRCRHAASAHTHPRDDQMVGTGI